MDMLIIKGGVPLAGEVRLAGAKNAALPIMAASLAVSGRTTLHRVPQLADVKTLQQVLESLGAVIERDLDSDRLTINPPVRTTGVAAYELVRRMRASVCVLGPLLARWGRAVVSLPGGCNIGHRPIDLHLKGLAALGAEIRIERGYVVANAGRLRGADIYLGGPFGSTVTGTANVMSAACLASGTTRIAAAACEPEIVDLGNYLNAAGARISGHGTPVIEIEGVEELQAVEHAVIPDRIEAGTLMVAAAATCGDIFIEGAKTRHLSAVIDILRQIGVSIEPGKGASGSRGLHVSGMAGLLPTDCTALPYPGIPTDLQAQLTALLCLVPGISVVTDKVFPDRFMHVPELMRMGARIRREGASAIISGPAHLSGTNVMASDLRASAALMIAALAAEGDSVIRRVYHLDRGYERLDEKLVQLGARITRTPDLPEALPASLRVNEVPVSEGTDERAMAPFEVPTPHFSTVETSLPIDMGGHGE
ncbi:MAG: UDP-N-acetylglucosamine 1-carboxyvinyltransferase [Planctomyces sp.]|nr:UDP-N-acetylglucosamine 1-carboxyvinyltransferase [Planctomyces sp.]